MATEKISSLQLQSAGMPNDDQRAHVWLQNFAEQLQAMADVRHAAGVSDEQCQRIVDLVKAFDAAYEVASDHFNRTAPDIRAKTLARNEAVKAIRPVANAIKANLDISTVQLMSLGIEHKSTEKKRQAHESEKHRRIMADMCRASYRPKQARVLVLPVAESA